MMHRLALPREDVARRLLDTFPYRQRLAAGRLMPPVGMLRGDVRSLAELHLLLAPDIHSLPGINLKALAEWVRNVVGDGDLALLIEQVVESAESYAAACVSLYELVGQRLEQAREVEGGPHEPSADACA
jgi:hypothetical protein